MESFRDTGREIEDEVLAIPEVTTPANVAQPIQIGRHGDATHWRLLTASQAKTVLISSKPTGLTLIPGRATRRGTHAPKPAAELLYHFRSYFGNSLRHIAGKYSRD
jgi:hypothetical protein